MPAFSNLLKAEMSVAGVTGAWLAAQSATSIATVSRSLNGHDAPRPELVEKWYELLKIDSKRLSLDDWQQSAAMQRAANPKIKARDSGGQLLKRIEHLERMERNLAAVAASLVGAFVKDSAQRNALLNLIERDVAMLQTEDAVRSAVSAALTGQRT